jgi:general secretion pathway protein F
MPEGELGPGHSASITIDQLLALNAEIIALVRAGVPLERGLLVTARELRGRLGRIAGALGRRLSRGESLVEALEGEGRAIPPLYRAVVEAGARSGRLPVALEGLARYVRGYSEARATIGLALWYPIVVISLAYGLFIGLVTLVVPRFIGTFEALRITASPVIRGLARLGQTVEYWWPVGPIALFVLVIGWLRSGAAARFKAPSWSWLRFFPWMKSILANYESASFSELLALLLEHDVAYPVALDLAAESTGNPQLVQGARQLAEAITRGEQAAPALRRVDERAFLPMLRWVLATGQQQGSLVAALHNLADLYRRRAAYLASKLGLFLPTILMLALGGSATLLYGLALFLPVINVLRQLSLP